MDASDELYFQQQLQEYTRQYLREIAEDCLELFREAINESVYQSYTPSWYDRTMQLIDNCTYKIENNLLYIYINTDAVTYHSWVNYSDTGKEVGSAVPYFVENGHRDSSGIDNQYHNYEPRYYLEKAKMNILLKYGFNVEIINDKPSMV